jgi:hypothetical protein
VIGEHLDTRRTGLGKDPLRADWDQAAAVTEFCSRQFPRQELSEPLTRIIGQPRENVHQCARGRTSLSLAASIDSSNVLVTFIKAGEGPVPTPDRASSQLKVCNLSFSELSAWRSNTWVAIPLKVAGLPSLSLPLALQLAVP